MLFGTSYLHPFTMFVPVNFLVYSVSLLINYGVVGWSNFGHLTLIPISDSYLPWRVVAIILWLHM